MNEDGSHPKGLFLAVGLLFLMTASALGGYVLYKYVDDVDVDALVFDTWLNQKRDLIRSLDMIQAPVDDIGNPLAN